MHFLTVYSVLGIFCLLMHEKIMVWYFLNFENSTLFFILMPWQKLMSPKYLLMTLKKWWSFSQHLAVKSWTSKQSFGHNFLSCFLNTLKIQLRIQNNLNPLCTARVSRQMLKIWAEQLPLFCILMFTELGLAYAHNGWKG